MTPQAAAKNDDLAAVVSEGAGAPLTALVPQIVPRPVFLIWTPRSGTEGLNPLYQRLAGDTASIWKIPESDHIAGIYTRPQEYEQRVIGFLDEALHGE